MVNNNQVSGLLYPRAQIASGASGGEKRGVKRGVFFRVAKWFLIIKPH